MLRSARRYARGVAQPRGVGIKDVAREAGVSTTTVSHALSGKGRLPDETRARVRRIAEEMGYRPSPVARSLAAGRTGVLGIAFSVHPEVEANFFALDWYTRIVNGATDRAMQAGYALVVVPPMAGPQIWGRLPLDGTIVVEPVPDDPNLSRSPRTGCVSSRSVRPPGSMRGPSTTTTPPSCGRRSSTCARRARDRCRSRRSPGRPPGATTPSPPIARGAPSVVRNRPWWSCTRPVMPPWPTVVSSTTPGAEMRCSAPMSASATSCWMRRVTGGSAFPMTS